MAERARFDFDDIHFTGSFLAPPEWRGEEMVVAARSFILCGDHPLADERRLRSGLLVFGGVARSTRTIHEYGGDESRPPYSVEDGGSGADGGDLTDYRFGGVLELPPAWIEWTILARSFELELAQE